MKTCRDAIRCLFLVAFCFYHVLSKKEACTELRRHRKWPELRRASSVCGLTGASINPRVMGGRHAALSEFPWMALLRYSSCSAKCGGFLITGRHVLTAAHCCDLNHLVNECNVIGVTLGEYDLESSVDCYKDQCAPEPIQVPVNKVASHEEFDWSDLSHDICLLTLDKSVQFSTFIKPICLPEECNWKEPDYTWDELEIAGWGFKKDAPGGQTLQTLNMMAIPHSMCGRLWETAYGLQVDESRQLCAGMEFGRDSCKGDSGGPLMYQAPGRMVAVGIASFGENCSDNTFLIPGVYTRLAHYMPWILDNMSN